MNRMKTALLLAAAPRAAAPDSLARTRRSRSGPAPGNARLKPLSLYSRP